MSLISFSYSGYLLNYGNETLPLLFDNVEEILKVAKFSNSENVKDGEDDTNNKQDFDEYENYSIML